MRWEYKKLFDDNLLSQAGEEGWELVSVVMEQGIKTFYLKRPVPGLSQQITLEQRQKVYQQKQEGSQS